MGDTLKPVQRGMDVGRDGGRLVDVALGRRSDFRGLAANAESQERSRQQETVLASRMSKPRLDARREF